MAAGLLGIMVTAAAMGPTSAGAMADDTRAWRPQEPAALFLVGDATGAQRHVCVGGEGTRSVEDRCGELLLELREWTAECANDSVPGRGPTVWFAAMW